MFPSIIRNATVVLASILLAVAYNIFLLPLHLQNGGVTGVGCRNRHDFVDEIHVQNGGDESGADALELVWAGFFAGNYCAAIGFDGGDMDLRQYFFQYLFL